MKLFFAAPAPQTNKSGAKAFSLLFGPPSFARPAQGVFARSLFGHEFLCKLKKSGFALFIFLAACDNHFGLERKPEISAAAKARGVIHPFAQGADDNLYSLKKLDGKSLKIKTSGGEPAASLLTKASDGLRIEDEGKGGNDPGFISIFHQKLRYTAEKGADPLLKSLLPDLNSGASDNLNFKRISRQKI